MVLSRVAIFRRYGVASEHPLASLAGFEVLQNGGNAADAAFATSFAVSVTQHPLGGIGGDFFAFYFDSEREKLFCLNSSGWAPSGAGKDMLKNVGLKKPPTFGPLSVVVPGMVAGIFELHSRFGSMKHATLLKRAIEFAEEGFPVSNNLERSIRTFFNELPDKARDIFGRSGRPLKTGELLKQEKLASTLREIASLGPSAFYGGRIGTLILEELNKEHSLFTKEDLESFKPEWVEPIHVSYRGKKVIEMPANTMGPVTLRIIDALKEEKLDFEPNSYRRIKLFLDIYRAAYSWKEKNLGDPRFVTSSPKREGSTTSFSVVDEKGNFVVAIQSLYHHFGSRVYVADAGIFMNNRGSAFSMKGPNSIEPKKRPAHTLSTLLVEDSGRRIGIGTSGGDFRPQLHTLFITNIIDWKMSLEESIDYPRFLWQKEVVAERGYNIRNLSYRVEEKQYPSPMGVAAGLEVSEGYKKLVCDVRGDGIPVAL